MPKSTGKIRLSGLQGPPSSQTTARRGSTTAARPLLPGGPLLWLLAGLAIGLSIWFGGRAYLRQMLAENLQQAQSEQAALESIDALLRLDANATIEVSRGLGHPEFMVANAAFRALGSQLDAWAALQPADRLRRMQQVVAELVNLPDELDQDHRILISGLASRIYADTLSNREPGAAALLEACRTVMTVTAGSSNESSLRLAQLQLPVDGSSASESISSGQANPVPPPLPPLDAASADPSPPSPSIDSSSQRFTDDRLIDEQSQTSRSSASSAMPRLTLSDNATDQDALGLEARPLTTRTAPQLAADSSSRVRATTVALNPLTSRAAHPRVNDVSSEQEALAISGMDELPIDELVRLLSSLQPRIAQAAALALRQRGMSERNLSMAIELASGSAELRSRLLSELVTRDDLDPRPWLVWMAADGQDSVRMHAVSLLQPLADQDVRRQLRLLLNKERDDQVALTIRRVLAQ